MSHSCDTPGGYSPATTTEGEHSMSQHRSRRTKRPMLLTAAAGAGMVLSAPAAALFVQPAVAQAAPLDDLTGLFGGGLGTFQNLTGGGLGSGLGTFQSLI